MNSRSCLSSALWELGKAWCGAATAKPLKLGKRRCKSHQPLQQLTAELFRAWSGWVFGKVENVKVTSRYQLSDAIGCAGKAKRVPPEATRQFTGNERCR